MQRIKKKIYVLFAFITVLSALSGCAKREFVVTRAFSAKELMRINNQSCYLPEMMLYLTTIQNQYEAVYGEGIWEEEQDGITLENKVKDMVLAKLAQVKVMNLMAENYKLSLSDAEDKKVQETAETFYSSLNDKEKELLEVTQENIYEYYKEYALAEKVYEYVIRDVNPEISDDEARTVSIQQILIKTYSLDSDGRAIEYSKRMKEEALEKAKLVQEMALEEETSFESLAAKYNEGDEVSLTFGRGEINKNLEEAAFLLDKDEISGVIETEYGYHIIKCVSEFDLLTTQDNKGVILRARKEQVFDETYDEFLTGLTKTLNEKLYKGISMIHDEDVTTTSFFDVDF